MGLLPEISAAVFMTGMFAFFLFLYCLLKILKEKISNKKPQPPQPKGAWPVLGHLPLLSGPLEPHVLLGNIADKYGPIFIIKLGVRRSLVISSWELAKECFTTNDKILANRPSFLAAEVMGYNSAMLGFSSYGQYWRQMRKITTLELLSNHRLQMFKHVRESEVQSGIRDIYQKQSKDGLVVVKMKQWFADVTLNVIFRIIFGKRYVNCTVLEEEDGDHSDQWREAIRNFFVLSGKFVVADALPFLRWLDVGGYEKSMKITARELDVVVQSWLDEHKRKKALSGSKVNGEEDFMDVMLSILEDSEELLSVDADTVNKATCLALILAASGSTKVSLVWALAILVNHPEILKKAQQELDAHVGRKRIVQESDMKNLVYLQAILKETLRLNPSAPLSVPHESAEDCSIGGYHILKGTRLIVNLWKLQRDPRVWSDPLEFKPERFLTSHKDFEVRGQNLELIPFGSGRRMCPGISFALQVMELTLATLLHGFDITIPDGKNVNLNAGFGLETNDEATQLELVLTPRLPTHLYS
ncbi:cytochrome P450 CYP82D47-like [Mercurialis annua]|uniref:cytochrome P450 CYP82D47-like n=1 Tax=Mercurialis annua TaxID=3986 RepID=UPI00215FB7BC|nr:cytochrome P450 CYP82D47-like [Mercurialis annua]